MALTDTAIRKAKPTGKAFKLTDEKGLFLLIAPAGGKLWRYKYRFADKEKLLALGVYPDVSLKAARKRRDEARELLAQGIDPAHKRKLDRHAQTMAAANTFEAIAREWFAKHSPKWALTHSSKIISRFERDVFPWLGLRPIKEITAPEILAVLRRMENRGAVDSAHRAHQNCGQVFRYAVATGRAERDPTGDLRGAIPPARKTHYATIKDPKAIGELLRAIESYHGSFITKCALNLAPMLFVRPGELRKAEWNEINLDTAEWRIPATKMKSRADHIVPLPTQAVAILRELHHLTGAYTYVFPGGHSTRRPMSENAVNAALRRMGFGKDEITGHGFRHMASTLLHEQGWKSEVIERQLAHRDRDETRAAYNHAQHLPERRKMMQHWADYLDVLKNGAQVISMGRIRGN